MSEEQNSSSRAPKRNDHRESTGTPKEAGTQEATSTEAAPSVEETMDSVFRRLKEKRQHFNLPEAIKVFNMYNCFFQNWIVWGRGACSALGVHRHPVSPGTAARFLLCEMVVLV